MKAVGIIIATKSSPALGALTENRATASIPFAGAFRTIDFSISNMSNSGIKKIAIISQANTKSLHDHLRSSKWWKVGSKKEGLHVLSPVMSDSSASFYHGSADAIYKNLDFLEKSYEEYAVIANGECVYKVDFNDIIEKHISTGADITIATQKNTRDLDMRHLGNVVIDESGRVLELVEQPLEPISDTYFTGIYVIKRKLLIELIRNLANEYRYRLREDLLSRHAKHINIQSYDLTSYWSSIHTTDFFFKANMDFLKDDIRNAMFRQEPYIYTKPKDLPPAKYNFSATVKNSIVGRGSIIDGNVIDSVVFRDVKIGGSSTIRNSIVMEFAIIGNNVHLENVILDKGCIVDNDVVYIGDPENIKIFAKGSHITIHDELKS